MSTKARCYVAGFEGEGRGYEPRNAALLAGKDIGTFSPRASGESSVLLIT